jgi:acyl-coenzyme A thioesterase PaaI-like protein
MSALSAVTAAIPRLDGPRNAIRDLWDRLHRLPGGKRLFSRLLGLAAPYTGSMGAQVVDLRHGRSETRLADRRAVRNHLKSIHAVALANLVELTGNVAVAYSIPDDARFIVAGMSVDYVKKARGTITGVCEVEVPASSERKEIEVRVSLRDASGDEVARGTLRTLIGPKKSAKDSAKSGKGSAKKSGR